jgi:hypothetical protein
VGRNEEEEVARELTRICAKKKLAVGFLWLSQIKTTAGFSLGREWG